MNEKHTLGIFEAGISQPDEMERLQPIIAPTIGIITNIGEAHQENFISSTQKCLEKLALFNEFTEGESNSTVRTTTPDGEIVIPLVRDIQLLYLFRPVIHYLFARPSLENRLQLAGMFQFLSSLVIAHKTTETNTILTKNLPSQQKLFDPFKFSTTFRIFLRLRLVFGGVVTIM